MPSGQCAKVRGFSDIPPLSPPLPPEQGGAGPYSDALQRTVDGAVSGLAGSGTVAASAFRAYYTPLGTQEVSEDGEGRGTGIMLSEREAFFTRGGPLLPPATHCMPHRQAPHH